MMRIENGEFRNYNRSKLNRRTRPDDEERDEYEPRSLRFNPHLIRKAIPTIPNQGARIFPERKNWRARGGDAASDWAAFTNEFTNPDSLLNQTDDKLRDFFKGVENELGEVFDPNKNGVRELFENFRNEVGPLIGQMGDKLKYDLDPELNGVNQAFRDAKGDIDKAFENIGQKMWDFYRDYIFPFPLASALGRAWKPLGDLFHNLTDKDWWEDKLNDPETYFWVAQTILTVASVWLGPMTAALAAGTVAALRLITKASLGQEVYASEILDIGLCLLPQGRLMRPARPGGAQMMSFGDVVMDTVKTLIKNQRSADPNKRLRSMGQGLCAAVACGEDYEIIPPVNRKGFIQTAIQNSNEQIRRDWNLEKRGEYVHLYNVYVQDKINMGKKSVTSKENGKDVTKEVDDIRAIESYTKYQIELDDFKDRDKIPKVLLAEEIALKTMEMWKHNKKVLRENRDYETEDLLADIPVTVQVVSGIDFKTGEAFNMDRPIKPAQSAGSKVGNIFLMRQKVEYREGEFAAKCLDANFLPPKASDTAWKDDPKARVFECMKDIPFGTSTFVNPAPKAGETFESVYNAKGGYWRECTLEYANSQPGASTFVDPREQYIADCKRFRELYYIMKYNESYAVDLARDRTIIQDRLKKEFPVRVANTAQTWLTAIIKNEVESYSRAIKGESTVYNYKTNPKLKEENTQYMFKYYTEYWTNYYHGPNYFLSVEEAKAYYAAHPDKYPGNPIYERDYSKGTSGQWFTGKEWLGYDPDMLSTQKRIDAAREGKLGKRLDLPTLDLRRQVETANEYGFDLEGNDLSTLVMVDPGQPPFNPDDYGLDFHKQVELHMYRFFTCDFNEKNKHASKTDKGDSLTCLFNTTTQFPNPDNPSEMLSFSKVVDAIEKELNKNYEYDDDRIKEAKYDDSEAYFQSVLGMSRDEKLAYFRSLFDTAEMVLQAYSIKYPTTLLHDSPIWNKSTKRIEIPALSPQQLLDLGLGTKVNEQLHYNSIQGYNQEEFIARDVKSKSYENNWIGRKQYEEDLAFRVNYERSMSAYEFEAYDKERAAEFSRIHDYDEALNTHNILVPLDKGTEAVSFPWQIAPPDQVIIGKNDDATMDALKVKYQEGLKLSKTTAQMSTEKVAKEKRDRGLKMMQEVKDYIESLFAYLYPYQEAWINDRNPGYNGTINLNQVYRVFKGSQKGSLNPKTSIAEFSEDYFLKHFMDEELAKPRPAMTEKIGHVDRVIEPWSSYKGLKETDRPYTRKDVEKKALESIKKAAVMLAAQNPNFYEVYTTNGMTDVIKYYKTIMDINDIEEEQRLATEYPKNVASWGGKLKEFIENYVSSTLSKLDAIPEFLEIDSLEKENVQVNGVWKTVKTKTTRKVKNPDWVTDGSYAVDKDGKYVKVNDVMVLAPNTSVPERKDRIRQAGNAALSILNTTDTLHNEPFGKFYSDNNLSEIQSGIYIKKFHQQEGLVDEFTEKYGGAGQQLITAIFNYIEQNPKPNEPPPHLEPEDDEKAYQHALEKYQTEMALYTQMKEQFIDISLGVDKSEEVRERLGKHWEKNIAPISFGEKPILSLPKSYKKGEDFEEEKSETQRQDEITLANYTKELESYTAQKNGYVQEYLNRVPLEQRNLGFQTEQEVGDYYDALSTSPAIEGNFKTKPIPPTLQSDGLSPVFRSSDPKRDAYLQKTRKNYETNKKIREGYETQSKEDIQWFADREEYRLKLKHDIEDMKAEQKADMEKSKVPKEALAALDKLNLENKLKQEETERKLQQQKELERVQKIEREALLEAERKKNEELSALSLLQAQKEEAERAAKMKSDQEAYFKNYEEERLKNVGLPSFPSTFPYGTYDRSVVINGVFTPHYPVEVFDYTRTPTPTLNYINPSSPFKKDDILSKPGEAYHPKPINLKYAKEVQLMEEQDAKDEEAKKENPDLEDENIDPYDELLVEGLDQRTLDSIPSFKLMHPNASRAYIRMAYGLEPPSPEFLSGAMGAGKSRNYKRRKLNRL